MSLHDDLMTKLKVLCETTWSGRAKEKEINRWLDNFAAPGSSADGQRLHALYLLSHFMYFGDRQMRELMRVLYRDLFRYPAIAAIRAANSNTTDITFITAQFQSALDQTLFLGMGNPAESGCHLLYYFRQENGLPKTRFIHTHQIFRRRLSKPWSFWNAVFFRHLKAFATTRSLRDPKIRHYVFIDDFCGSGSQGIDYSNDIVEDIKAVDPSVRVSYFMLFATSKGMGELRTKTKFDDVQCIFELDESFRCFSSTSRYFIPPNPLIDKAVAEALCRYYGDQLCPGDALGFGDCQLLLGFHHNTPDNTLPIIWYDEPTGRNWFPIFKRYTKYYA